MSGTWTECSRKYGYERYELQNIAMKIGTIEQKDHKRVLYIGPKIYTVTEDGRATVIDNPMFEQTVAAMKNADPMTMSRQLLGSLGFAETGESLEIVGHTCNVAAGPLGSMCITPNGIVLQLDTVGTKRTAVSVDLSSGGDEANYMVPDNAVQEPSIAMPGAGGQDGSATMPDMGDLKSLMEGLLNK